MTFKKSFKLWLFKIRQTFKNKLMTLTIKLLEITKMSISITQILKTIKVEKQMMRIAFN